MATGDKDWTAGQTVAAADMDDYLQLQVLAQYATSTARDTALSSRKREGMTTYQLDTNTLTVYSGSAWSTIGPVHGALTSWTPVVVQGATPTLTNNLSQYIRLGRWIMGSFQVTITSGGTAANTVTISLPVTARSSIALYHIGTASIEDSSAPLRYFGTAVLASTTTMAIATDSGAVGIVPSSFLGSTGFTAALANGDYVQGNFAYEAAGDA